MRRKPITPIIESVVNLQQKFQDFDICSDTKIEDNFIMKAPKINILSLPDPVETDSPGLKGAASLQSIATSIKDGSNYFWEDDFDLKNWTEMDANQKLEPIDFYSRSKMNSTSSDFDAVKIDNATR